ILAADPSVDMPRLGITQPVHLVCGKLDVHHQCEVVTDTRGPPILLGQDLIPKLKINIFGLPYEYATANDPLKPSSNDETPSLTPEDFSEEEKSKAFQCKREAILSDIAPYLQANASIPSDAHCPLPESEIFLETPPGKIVFRRQYPIAFKMAHAMD